MFAPNSKVRLQGDVPVDLAGNATAGIAGILQKVGPSQWNRFTQVPVAEVEKLHARGERRTGKDLYDLNNIYRLRISQGQDIWRVAEELQNLPGIFSARPVPRPTLPPTPPDYQSQQRYLAAAANTPTGIDALYAWAQPGGTGASVTVCDLEYSWNYNHADISQAPGSQINTNVADPFNDDNHGTAVIGELVADLNGWGTTGVCHGANLLTCGTYFGTPPAWNVPGAITLAMSYLNPGDVLLIEQQWDFTGSGGFVPIEWWTHLSPSPQSNNAVYVAIQIAVANGIIVVEAGGNGGLDTDNMTWLADSGAIIVGSGGAFTGGTWPNGDLQRLSHSSYGSRFHLQGWGEDVYTTGYGHLYAAEGKDYWYTAWFDGTSSASPIVAGAAAVCVGWWKANVSAIPPTPNYIRSLLVSTGTPQVTPPVGTIGPRPDLQTAISAMSAGGNWFDVTTSTLQNPLNGKGVAWGDYDNDGDLDLYLANTDLFVGSSRNILLRNDGGGLFGDASAQPVNDWYSGSGTAWGDCDNDGDLDLYLGNYGGPNMLFRNDGGGTFTDISAPPVDDSSDAGTVNWIDYDGDGLLDIFVANHFGQQNKLFHNIGGGNFTDVTAEPLAYAGSYCLTGAWGDFDNDQDLDLYLCCDYDQPNRLLRYDGGGNFTDVTSGPLTMPFNTQSAAWGDYDNDGDLDLYVTNNDWGGTGQVNYLLRNDGAGVFTDATPGTPLGVSGGSQAASWGDYDNDGDLDIYLGMNPGNNKLFRNDGGGSFTDVSVSPLSDGGYAQGLAWGDYDNDGDIDLYLANYQGSNKLFRNDDPSGNHWLHVALVGTQANRDGIGARIRIVVAGAAQIREVGGEGGYCTQNSIMAEFGLGSATVVDVVQIWWPRRGKSGPQEFTNVPADQVLICTEPDLTPVDLGGDLATVFRLHPPAPNPFNPQTTLSYDLPVEGHASLQVFDISGRLIRTLVPATAHQPGRHYQRWDGRDQAGRPVASGVYFCRLEAGHQRQVGRLVLVR
jgi:hypothetical protein